MFHLLLQRTSSIPLELLLSHQENLVLISVREHAPRPIPPRALTPAIAALPRVLPNHLGQIQPEIEVPEERAQLTGALRLPHPLHRVLESFPPVFRVHGGTLTERYQIRRVMEQVHIHEIESPVFYAPLGMQEALARPIEVGKKALLEALFVYEVVSHQVACVYLFGHELVIVLFIEVVNFDFGQSVMDKVYIAKACECWVVGEVGIDCDHVAAVFSNGFVWEEVSGEDRKSCVFVLELEVCGKGVEREQGLRHIEKRFNHI